jgi:MerR family mercuric resistance operon transcriptional regulator
MRRLRSPFLVEHATVCSRYRRKGFLSAARPGSGTAIAIGELAQRTRCNVETIRYYERVGLLPVPGRKGRFRRYGRADVQRLAFVRRARVLGFTLDEVRALLGSAAGGDGSCDEVRVIAAAHLADVQRKVADLQTMASVLAELVHRCDAGEAPGCPLINAIFGRRDLERWCYIMRSIFGPPVRRKRQISTADSARNRMFRTVV